MKQSSFVIGGIILLIILIAAGYWFSKQSNASNLADTELKIPQNFITLDNFDQLSEIFDSDSGYVRVIALLSPTWPASARGFSGIQEIAGKLPDVRIRFYIVWIPIYQADTWKIAVKQSNRFQDKRLTYFWDPNQISGITWQQALNIDQTAWDLYFIYGREKQWQFEPTVPDYWMRQLKGIAAAPLFDAALFEKEIKVRL